MGFIDEIKTKAKADLKTIVLPETEDVRTYEAAEAILKGDSKACSDRKRRGSRKK